MHASSSFLDRVGPTPEGPPCLRHRFRSRRSSRPRPHRSSPARRHRGRRGRTGDPNIGAQAGCASGRPEIGFGHRDARGCGRIEAEPVPSSATISPPPARVRLTIASIFSWLDRPIFTRSGTGMPLTVDSGYRDHRIAMAAENEGVHILHHTSNSSAMKWLKRANRARRPSRRPCCAAGPKIRAAPRPSRPAGGGCTITKASGSVHFDAFADRLHDFQVDAGNRPARPRLRGTPAVTMMTSAPAMSA